MERKKEKDKNKERVQRDIPYVTEREGEKERKPASLHHSLNKSYTSLKNTHEHFYSLKNKLCMKFAWNLHKNTVMFLFL